MCRVADLVTDCRRKFGIGTPDLLDPQRGRGAGVGVRSHNSRNRKSSATRRSLVEEITVFRVAVRAMSSSAVLSPDLAMNLSFRKSCRSGLGIAHNAPSCLWTLSADQPFIRLDKQAV
jgi:hypothetical protein